MLILLSKSIPSYDIDLFGISKAFCSFCILIRPHFEFPHMRTITVLAKYTMLSRGKSCDISILIGGGDSNCTNSNLLVFSTWNCCIYALCTSLLQLASLVLLGLTGIFLKLEIQFCHKSVRVISHFLYKLRSWKDDSNFPLQHRLASLVGSNSAQGVPCMGTIVWQHFSSSYVAGHQPQFHQSS